MANVNVFKTDGPLAVDETTRALLVMLASGADIAALLAVLAGGLPTYGTDPTGADGYALIATAPARECHCIHVAVENFGMILSLDNGSTDHFAIPANTERLFPNLKIPAGSIIKAKNLVGGSNFTNGRVSVW